MNNHFFKQIFLIYIGLFLGLPNYPLIAMYYMRDNTNNQENQSGSSGTDDTKWIIGSKQPYTSEQLQKVILRHYKQCLNLVQKIQFNMEEEDCIVDKWYESVMNPFVMQIIKEDYLFERDNHNPQTLWSYVLLRNKHLLKKMDHSSSRAFDQLYLCAHIITQFIHEVSNIPPAVHTIAQMVTDNEQELTDLELLLKNAKPSRYSLQKKLKQVMKTEDLLY